MVRNILFVLACAALAGLAFALFRVLGMHFFSLMMIITLAALLTKPANRKTLAKVFTLAGKRMRDRQRCPERGNNDSQGK